jgi:type I restriction enzyme, S subunit
MAGDAKKLMLADVVTLQRGTTYKSALLGQSGPALLGLASIQRHGGFRDDNLKTYGGDSPEKLTLRPGDIYVSLKDVTQSAELLGAVARVPQHIPSGRVTQDTAKLTFINKGIPSRYIYWVLRTPVYREYCRLHAIGTTNLSISRDDFLSFPIPRPTDQDLKLVEILDALDDKIELNRRMNATLEAMARALFQSWFVDFDPVRAKLDGRAPTAIDPATTALFPDSFHETKVGHIPTGWQVGRLADLCNLKRGHDLPTSTRTEGSIPVVSSSGVSGSHSETNVRGPGVVTGRYGTIGKVFYIETDYWPLNTTLYVDDFKGNPPRFIFHALGEVDFTNYTDKAAVPGVNRNHLHEEPTVIPPMEIRQAFARAVAPLWSQHAANELQSRTLATLRDTLLPKLLSGDLSTEGFQTL